MSFFGKGLDINVCFKLTPPSYSHLQASIYKKNVGGIFFFFSVFKVLLLDISKTDSDC